MSKDNVLTEEIFDEIVSKMVEDTNCPKNYWEMKHPPVSSARARKIKEIYPDKCLFCDQNWEECKKWRKEQEEKMKKRRFFNEN